MEPAAFAASGHEIREQTPVPWSVIFSVSMRTLSRRRGRSFIAMVGVVLAIAFLCYMLINHQITKELIEVNKDDINLLLNSAGVERLAKAGTQTRLIILICLSLLTCLVGITNAMLMSVTERVKEIGTLKCLGALDSFIVKTFFIESLLQGVAGTLLGIVIGSAVAFAAGFYNFGAYAFSHCPWLAVAGWILVAFVIGSTISMLAAIAPALWAARKQPVEALRVEE